VLLLSPRQPLACDSPTALWDWVTLQGDTLTGQGCDSAEAIARQPATVLVWPAQALSWLQLSLPKAPAHKLRALLDGLLEERLLSDLADLHYALAPGFRPGRAADTWVLCCQREPLQRAVDYLQAIAHPLAAVLPACAPQPALQARPWVWVSGSSEAPALLASAAHGALWLPLQPHASAADRALLHSSLQAVGALDAGSAAWASPALVGLAEHLLPDLAWQTRSDAHPWQQALASGWDLAQFDLRLRARSARWQLALERLRQLWGSPAWRPLRWGLGALVALQLLGLNLNAWQARQEIAQLRQLSNATLQQSFPHVQLVLDAPLQMQREIDRLRQARSELSPNDLEPLLEQLGRAHLRSPFELRQLRFDSGSAELAHAPLSAAAQQELGAALAPSGWQFASQGHERSTLRWASAR